MITQRKEWKGLPIYHLITKTTKHNNILASWEKKLTSLSISRGKPVSSNVINGAGTSPPYAIYFKIKIQSSLKMIKHIDHRGYRYPRPWTLVAHLGCPSTWQCKNIQRPVIFRQQDHKQYLTGICIQKFHSMHLIKNPLRAQKWLQTVAVTSCCWR